jgi:hypothetical protein
MVLALAAAACRDATPPGAPLASTSASEIRPAVTYTLLNLHPLGPFIRSSTAEAVNRAGVVVGWGDGLFIEAFRYHKGKMKILPRFGGAHDAYAYDVNSGPLVVGCSGAHAILWDVAATPRRIPMPAQYRAACARGVNDDGVIVGWYEALDGSLRGFRWRHPAAASTDLVPAGVPYDVSVHGHAVGTVLDAATGIWHGAVWFADGRFRDLGAERGGHTYLTAIDVRHRVVGYTEVLPLGTPYPVAGNTSAINVVPFGVGELTDLSDLDRAVGYRRTGARVEALTRYAGFYTFLPELAYPSGSRAKGVNRCGVIVGESAEPAPGGGAEPRAVVWTPDVCD